MMKTCLGYPSQTLRIWEGFLKKLAVKPVLQNEQGVRQRSGLGRGKGKCDGQMGERVVLGSCRDPNLK